MTDKLLIQYLTDENGKHTAAVIPIADWKEIEQVYRDRIKVKASLHRAFLELKDIKTGKASARPVQELLDEM